jgi:hypothetical protein
MEQLLQAIEQQAVTPPGLTAEQRLRTLVRLACGADAPELPWFDAGMLALEAGIAEGKHHRRVHEELLAAWTRVFDACTDLPQRPSADAIQAMHLAVWGGHRYGLLIGLSEAESLEWARQMERLCLALLNAG